MNATLIINSDEGLHPPIPNVAASALRLAKVWMQQLHPQFAGVIVASQGPAPAIVALQSTRQKNQTSDAFASGDGFQVRFQRDIVPQLDAAYNFARFLSRDADAAQDIVQDAFLRAYRNFDGYQGGDPGAWVFAIVRNCYRDWLLGRRRKARLEVEVASKDAPDGHDIAEVPSEDDTPEIALLRRLEAGAVRTALNQLPRPLREILILRELEGLSYRQIADVASLPIGTVMSRLARARTMFGSIWRLVDLPEVKP